MGAVHAATLNRLLDAALQLPAERRAGWVEQLGPEFEPVKPRLRKLIARSLASSHGGLSTLPKLDDAAISSGISESLGEDAHVGRYRLRRRLGSGGMGVVWLARDEQAASERWVALKFAHATPERADLTTRLARERSLLAALAHPNIARLYDAGVTEDERLFLVLEYVEGLPLDVYCAERHVDLCRRLQLFVQIADAITHAHERRIVHRDLKPSNVLVTDGGETKLLDFGVAKLLVDGIPVHLQLSHLTGRPLTPEYASPEQINGEDVGFASDIYSLGVLLYESVAGVRPYAYRRGSNRALRQAIVETPPLAPSAVAGNPAIARDLTPELEAVILRALRKRPEQRYASMREFAAEIEHHARLLARSRH